jgi:hypothetical protein
VIGGRSAPANRRMLRFENERSNVGLELRAGETAPYVGDALLLEIVAGG